MFTKASNELVGHLYLMYLNCLKSKLIHCLCGINWAGPHLISFRPRNVPLQASMTVTDGKCCNFYLIFWINSFYLGLKFISSSCSVHIFCFASYLLVFMSMWQLIYPHSSYCPKLSLPVIISQSFLYKWFIWIIFVLSSSNTIVLIEMSIHFVVDIYKN